MAQPPMPPNPLSAMAEIVAFSRRQAMDWSLVLASQGIEAIIDHAADRDRWLLLVAPHELDRARESIRLYRAENRGWSWRKELPGSDLELHWGAIVFCVVLALIHSFVAYEAPTLQFRGAMDSVKVAGGEWWRLFTAEFLHGDLAHLAANVTFGIIVLGLAMGRFGAGLALLSTLLAGALGNFAGLKLYSGPYTGLGASGLMMGALGMITVHSLYLWKKNPRASRYILSGVGAGMFMFVMFGTNANSDVLAHFGGFVGGVLFGALLSLAPEKFTQKRFVDVAAMFFFVTISALAWILALR
jgi:rhomboid protease GluP